LGIVDKPAYNLLDVLLAGIVQEGTIVGCIVCLVILAICNWVWCKRAIMGFERRRVSMTGELVHDVFGHEEVNIYLGVISLEVNATIEITGVVFEDVVRLSSEAIVEVLYCVFANYLILKSSTARLNYMVWDTWLNKPGV
jgi:hypothetical protein